MQRVSQKQVKKILECLSYRETGYQLIIHDFCGKDKYYYKYSIARYSRQPEYTDGFGRVLTWTSWKHEEIILEFVSLKKAYEYASNILSESLRNDDK